MVTDHFSKQVRELRDHIHEDRVELCQARGEYRRDIERPKATVKQIQAALNLPQFADDD